MNVTYFIEPVPCEWHLGNFQFSEQTREGPQTSTLKRKLKWSVQLKETHSSGWSVLASKPWTQQGFGKVIKGCLTLSGQIDFQASLHPWRMKGRSPELRYIFVKSAVWYICDIVLDPIFMHHFYFLLLLRRGCSPINSYIPSWIRINNLSWFQVLRLYLFILLWFLCLHYITLPCPFKYTLNQLMWLDACRRLSEADWKIFDVI